MSAPRDPRLDTCNCCEPAPLDPDLTNPPGQPALAYRWATHGSLLGRLLAQIPTVSWSDDATTANLGAGAPIGAAALVLSSGAGDSWPMSGVAVLEPGTPAEERIAFNRTGDTLALVGATANAHAQGAVVTVLVRPLAGLTTRDPDDVSIGLLDAWSMTEDVLSFYQERIFNEGFLRTAVERRSVLELARAVGYELATGVAASTYLAFTIEAPSLGSPGRSAIPAGTKVMSVPAQNQKPQVFETIEAVDARYPWNALAPALTQPQPIGAGLTQLYLAGVATSLRAGDPILIVGDETDQPVGGQTDPAEQDLSKRWEIRFLTSVKTLQPQNLTLVTWQRGLGAGGKGQSSPPATHLKVFALRQRAALFGHNAPDWRSLPDETRQHYYTGSTPAEWPKFRILAPPSIDLDNAYPQIVAGSWLVLNKGRFFVLYRAKEVASASRADYSLSSNITRVKLNTDDNLGSFGIRGTVVYAQSEQLTVADVPIPDPVRGDSVTLGGFVADLAPGRKVAFTGKRIRLIRDPSGAGLQLTADDGAVTAIAPGELLLAVEAPVALPGGLWRWHLQNAVGAGGRVVAGASLGAWQPALAADDLVSEVVALDTTFDPAENPTELRLATTLQYAYDRTTLVISANVAQATHGETVAAEVLGSGDASQANQRFALKKSPLTYVSAVNATGAACTLVVRAAGVAWSETPSLYPLGPRDRGYIIRNADDASSTVIFGDGERGARLPSGVENLVASYRVGIGLDGQVAAGSLTLLQSRPLGVRSVTNPVAAAGAADPEKIEDARQNAPLKVLTLDRVVSLRDHEDFARAYQGIAKAQAMAVWSGERQVVHLTLAAPGGAPVTADQVTALLASIAAATDDPLQLVLVDSYDARYFKLVAKLIVDPAYDGDVVTAAVSAALAAAFAFDARSFGQPVTEAEIMTAAQAVAGVVAIDVQQLFAVDASGAPVPVAGGPSDALFGVLDAPPAHWSAALQAVVPASLLTLAPKGGLALAWSRP